jgi:radical SAM superfamily enzyme YgiQ (UPF0313 family)
LIGVISPLRLDISLRPASLSVMFGGAEALTYDRGGRLWSRWIGGHTFRRGLDGRVVDKWPAQGIRRRRWLDAPETARLLDESAARMRELRDHIAAGRVKWIAAPEDDELINAVDRAAQFDARAADRDRVEFERVYNPTGNGSVCIGILPPDQYLALVLQATSGCSFNTCTFCNFYADVPFRIRTPQMFREHAQAVRAFLGESIRIRKSIFLGEANALTIPFDRLIPLLAIARDEFGERPIYAFLDAFSGTKKSIDEYRQLASLGLRRVSVGLESGHDPLLKFVRKPGHAADAIETVTALKAAGIAVSLIVLIGLGGDRYAESHAADTVAALNTMPLGKGDIIYFSDLVEHDDTAYPALARAEGIRSLTADKMNLQRQAIRSGLKFGPGGPTLSKYDIREFVY